MTNPYLSQFQVNCIELLAATPKKQSRHCFRSALRHLELAEAIRATDPAMAIFRGITAEEEAASGLMWCMRELDYVGANSLMPRNHVHKHAAIPFLRIIGLFFGQTFEKTLKEYRLHIKDEDGQRRLMIAFPIIVAGVDTWAYPIPPLNFGVSIAGTGLPPSYSSQISAYVSAKGASSIKFYLKKEANLRNEILYAGPDGFPQIAELKTEFIQEKTLHVLTLLQAYLLIQPYPERQPYVQDALAAFLSAVGAIQSQGSASNEV